MSMRFCKECNNMLYPTENKENSLLKFECKICDYSETVEKNSQETNLVYRNEIKLGQTAVKIDPNIINDSTYARTKNITCPKCGYHQAIYFQNPNINDPGMKLVLLCCNKDFEGNYCGKWWFKEKDEQIDDDGDDDDKNSENKNEDNDNNIEDNYEEDVEIKQENRMDVDEEEDNNNEDES